MELILVRHAAPAEAAANHAHAADPPLGERGRRQAERVAAWLLRERLDHVISSPARRAFETAEATAAGAGLDVSVEPRLRDAEADDHPYVPIERDRALDPAAYRARLAAYRSSSRLPSIAARVNEALDEWTARARGGRIAAFCHGSVVNVYAARVLGLAQPAFFAPGYASGHRFLISSEGVRSVRSLNETAYLID